MYIDSEQFIGTHWRFPTMADEGTSKTLVLIAAVLQLIFFFVLGAMTALLAFTLAVLPTIPPSELPPGFPVADLMNVMMDMVILFGVMTVFAIIFAIIWFMWRSDPSQHKVGLIITGILGLLFSGFIPGLLVLIAGAITPKESTYASATEATTTAKAAPPASTEGVKYCAACGTPLANPNAQFCGVCGASMT